MICKEIDQYYFEVAVIFIESHVNCKDRDSGMYIIISPQITRLSDLSDCIPVRTALPDCSQMGIFTL